VYSQSSLQRVFGKAPGYLLACLMVVAFAPAFEPVVGVRFPRAIEAVQKGGRIVIHVYHSLEWSEPRRLGVRVTIADYGVGISAEHKSGIFQPFVTSKGEEGTGLGLWVSKGIVEKIGGSLRFRSRPSCPSGTCFSVFFPGTAPRGSI